VQRLDEIGAAQRSDKVRVKPSISLKVLRKGAALDFVQEMVKRTRPELVKMRRGADAKAAEPRIVLASRDDFELSSGGQACCVTILEARPRPPRAGLLVEYSWSVTPRQKLTERAARCGSKPKRRVVQVRRAASVRLCEIPGRLDDFGRAAVASSADAISSFLNRVLLAPKSSRDWQRAEAA
jgi:hypothetical protein